MSIGGPSALGTLLVQRLDAVLGTTLSQQTNLASGARPDAVSQPGQPLSPDPAQNQTARDSRSTVDKVLEQSGQQLRQTVEKTKLDAQQSILSGRNQPATSSTPSAPTTLGSAARAILALLQSFPESAPPLKGKSPLAGADPKAAPAQAGTPTQDSQQTPRTTAGAAATNQAGGPSGGAAPSGGLPSANSAAGNAASGVAGAPPGAVPNAPAATAAQFVQALSQTLQNSGLFYESHLSNVAFGAQDAATLHNEPQAHAGRNASAHPGSTAAPAPAEAAPRSGADAAQPNTAGTATAAQAGAAQNSALAGLHPDTHLLVRQQLEVLANQTIAWRGEAWPNAPMQWEVTRENSSSEHEEAVSHWATRLTLNLPNLGEIQARINLSDRQIVMQLVAPESATLLDQNQDALRSHLLARGLQVGALSVREQASEDPPAQQVAAAPEARA
ncbi:flagellar hook-length control protein FliK [Eoetvoesiella caeni]